mmetsp:Transcript_11733/g.23116  ORF Transcript_11733/g.23116 Transcript_11733/m.23116 type:complete len:122 (-) Transcript_11733:102-467(-)
MANYAVDLSMHNSTSSGILPSKIAAAAVIFACKAAGLKCNPELKTKILDSCYNAATTDLFRITLAMDMLYQNACRHETGTTLLCRYSLPKNPMAVVIRYYSKKFKHLLQNKAPSHHKRLFG